MVDQARIYEELGGLSRLKGSIDTDAMLEALKDLGVGGAKTLGTYGGLAGAGYGLSKVPGVRDLSQGVQDVYGDALNFDPDTPMNERLNNMATLTIPPYALLQATQRARMGKEAQAIGDYGKGLKPMTDAEKKKSDDIIKNHGGKDPDSKVRSKDQQQADMKERAKKNAKNPTIGSAGMKNSPYHQAYMQESNNQLVDKLKAVLGKLFAPSPVDRTGIVNHMGIADPNRHRAPKGAIY